RAEGRLADADHRLLADAVQRVAEADRRRCLALARRRRGDRGHQDQLAVRAVLQALNQLRRPRRLVMPVLLAGRRHDAGPPPRPSASSLILSSLALRAIVMSSFIRAPHWQRTGGPGSSLSGPDPVFDQ